MTNFNKPLDHINLTVPNLHEAIEFYTNKMGFTVKEHFKNGMEIVFITDGNITYELMENQALNATVIDHIAYASENIESDFDHFNKLGIVTTNIGYVNSICENGVYYFFIKGTGNEKIEFCQKKG